MKRILAIVIVLVLLFMYGCAPWQLVKEQHRWKYGKLEAVLPYGWMKFNPPPTILFLTKDGELLEMIRIFRYQIGKDKELPLSKKKFTNEMLMQEITELLINEMSLDKNTQQLKVLENIPASISGREAFKIQFSYNTPDSLKVKSVAYGFKENKFIYIIQYSAAEQYYFDKYLEVFKSFIENFKIA